MRKPNYSMDRKDRELTKQAKATAKVKKRALKGDESHQSDVSTTSDEVGPVEAERKQSAD